jgi:hypothetical protein
MYMLRMIATGNIKEGAVLFRVPDKLQAVLCDPKHHTHRSLLPSNHSLTDDTFVPSTSSSSSTV